MKYWSFGRGAMAGRADHAAGYVWYGAVFGGRSGLGGGLDRAEDRQQDPLVAGDEYIAWLMKRGRDPRKKRLIASDGLDVDEFCGCMGVSGAGYGSARAGGRC